MASPHVCSAALSEEVTIPQHLVGRDLEDTANALMRALRPIELERLVRIHAPDLEFEVDFTRDPAQVTYELLHAAGAFGLLGAVLRGAVLMRPANAPLVEVVQRVQGVRTPMGESLERVFRELGSFQDIHLLATGLLRVERQVCRVEIGDTFGSGFLVGPDLVLTNMHVVANGVEFGRATPSFRFDYRREEGGTTSEGVRVAAAREWAIAGRGPGEPGRATLTDLDYALCRLAEEVGRTSLEQEDGPRGWMALPGTAAVPPVGSPIAVVQHPSGGPMKLAIDSAGLVAPPNDTGRVRYRTNTEPGSSGSPVLDATLTPFALHHAGLADGNEGILLDRIRADLEARGYGGMLG